MTNPYKTKISNLKLIASLLFFGLWGQVSLSQVNLVATAGTTSATYPTISAAFAAINAGTHQGVINLTLTANTFEPTFPVALGVSGLGPTLYTGVGIKPSGNIIVTGNSSSNRSLVELFGATNVLIEGDDPATAGVRNLTFVGSASSFTSTSCIKIGSTATVPCTNIVIRNCIFNGSRPSSTNFTNNYCIVVGNNSTSSMVAAGQNNLNIEITNNDFNKANIAIACYATATSRNKNITIKNNTFGLSSNANDAIGQIGIRLENSSELNNNSTIENNEIKVGSTAVAGMTQDAVGIYVSTGNDNLNIDKNYIHDVRNTTTSATYNVAGIYSTGANNNLLITNNIIRDIIGAKRTTVTTGNSNYSIWLNSTGAGNMIINNTLSQIIPSQNGTVTNYFNSCVNIAGTASLTDFRNNIFHNNNVGTGSFCVYFQALATSLPFGSVMNNNCFYYPSCQAVNSTITPQTLSNWQLQTGNDYQSFVENPKYISTTNLHIQNGVITQLESGGASTIVLNDIDYEVRPGPLGSVNGGGTFPDIGADEFDGIIAIKPVITTVIHNPNTQSCVAASKTINAVITASNSLDSVMLEYSIDNAAPIYVKMAKISTTNYSYTIPAITPANAIVRYRAICILSFGDSIGSNYYYYNNFTSSRALTPNYISTPSQACIGSVVSLSYNYGPDPVGHIFPPPVVDSLKFNDITNVTIDKINNTSTLNSLTGTLGTATGVKGAYSNFEPFITDSLSLGKSYPISLTSQTNGASKSFFSVYIDLNGDGDYNDLFENTLNTAWVQTQGGRTELGTVYIAPFAKPGKTSMRVMVSTSQITSPNATLQYGEVEDYSIYIKPISASWNVNGTIIGTSNPMSYTITSLPTNYGLTMTDSSSCPYGPLTTKQITQTASSMSINLTGPTSACYNIPVVINCSVAGGCPPYSYTWSYNPSWTGPSQTLTVLDQPETIYVTVTDKNGLTAKDTLVVLSNNPKILSVKADTICNRGSGKLIVKSKVPSDSSFWYYSSTSDPFNYNYLGDIFTTPVLDNSATYYVAAYRSSTQTVGKTNQVGTFVNGIKSFGGLRFNTTEPIIIQNCVIYAAGTSTSQIEVAVLNKNGSIIKTTGLITVALTASTTTPITIPLNLLVETPDTGYSLVLVKSVGVSSFRYHTNGYTYPILPTSSMVVTGGYDLNNQNSSDYNYFYNIKILNNMCAGQKTPVLALVTPPIVPKIVQDLNYTQLCNGDSLKLTILSDTSANKDTTIGNRFTWYRNGEPIIDTTVIPYAFTTKKNTYFVSTMDPSYVGAYKVVVSSTNRCSRDTFSRTVQVNLYPEAMITSDLTPKTYCRFSNGSISLETVNVKAYYWYKNGVPIDTGYSNVFNFTNLQFSDSGYYQVIVQDKNNCKPDTSGFAFLKISDTLMLASSPIDTVICEGQTLLLKGSVTNATSYQWYKEGGIIPYTIYDSLKVWNTSILDSGTYRVVGKGHEGCKDKYSDKAHVKINPKPKITALNTPIKVCEGSKFVIKAHVDNDSFIKWYLDNNILSLTGDSIVISATLFNGGNYSYVAQPFDKCSKVKSDDIPVTVIKKPTITGAFPNTLKCEGDSFRRSFTTFGNTFQWYKNNLPVQNFTKEELFIRYLTSEDNGTYTLGVNSDNVCNEVRSNPFNLNIVTSPKVSDEVANQVVCRGNSVTLTVKASGYNNLSWFRNGILVPGNSTTLNIPSVTESNEGDYIVKLSGTSPCLPVESDTMKVRMKSGATNAYLTKTSIYNAKEQCTDGENWTYYATQEEPDKFIFAVRKKNTTLPGLVDLVVRPNVIQSVRNAVDEYSVFLMMSRFWNYKNETDSVKMDGNYDIKFYYDEFEKVSVGVQQSIFSTTYLDLVPLAKDPIWFRTDKVPLNNNTLYGIDGSKINFPILPINFTVSAIENGVNYVIFENINSYSGGSLYNVLKGPTHLAFGNGGNSGSGGSSSILGANQNLGFRIYPNPNNGHFNLELEMAKPNDVSYKIVNALGQVVFEKTILKSLPFVREDVNLPQLSNGIYHIMISNGDAWVTEQLIINH